MNLVGDTLHAEGSAAALRLERTRPVVPLLAVSAFVIVTTEFVIVGLLPLLAKDLGVGISTAGLLVTLYAFSVTLFGPLLTMLLAHLDRKRVFIWLLLIHAASNAVAAVSDSLLLMAVARVIPAAVLPLFWGAASDSASTLVGPQRTSRAVSNIYLGVSAAMVLGVPVGTLIGASFGWRSVFWGLAALSALMALVLWAALPRLPKPTKVPVAEQIMLFADRGFLVQLLISMLVFSGSFSAYTYLADLLETVTKVPPGQTGLWLMAFGCVGLIGNWLGGLWAGRDAMKATTMACLLFAAGAFVTMLLAGERMAILLPFLAWGIANTALFPICQVRVISAAPHAKALAGTCNVAIGNAGIGLGAMIGGLAVDQWGLQSAGIVGGIIALCTAGFVAWIGRDRRMRTG